MVLLTGARQVGKSTLVQTLSKTAWPARYLTLDDRTVLDAALADPDGFLQEAGEPLIIDEVQRAPDLLRAAKLIVDRDRRPGRFLLTGSANVLTLSTVSETLAGRVAVHELRPFSWAELGQKPVPSIIDVLFSSREVKEILSQLPSSSPPERMKEIQKIILTGSFPTPALFESDEARRTWFESYRQTYLERDLRNYANLEYLPDFNRLLSTLALRTGKLLNLSELSRDVGLPFSTLRRYFRLLSQTYQVFPLQPYHPNLGKRLVKTPKAYMNDTGLACYLSAADSFDTLARQHRAGPMAETWAANEITKLVSFSGWPTGVYFLRTQAGQEVDFLLERGDQVVGVEAKWGSGLGKNDLAGLKKGRELLGKKWRFGVLLHNGNEALALDDRTLALPYGVFFGREG